jgi:hypothetical protein
MAVRLLTEAFRRIVSLLPFLSCKIVSKPSHLRTSFRCYLLLPVLFTLLKKLTFILVSSFPYRILAFTLLASSALAGDPYAPAPYAPAPYVPAPAPYVPVPAPMSLPLLLTSLLLLPMLLLLLPTKPPTKLLPTLRSHQRQEIVSFSWAFSQQWIAIFSRQYVTTPR